MNEKTCFERLTTDITYSVRRYFVDCFFLEKIHCIDEQARIIDLGGKKINKRGIFNIDHYCSHVQYANLDQSTNPDFYCDIQDVPVADHTFDGVILAEVIEHVPEPEKIFAEAYRILKPGGIILLTTPFMYPVHADPHDYARYTAAYYQNRLSQAGFKEIFIQKQGLFFSVLALLLQAWTYELAKKGRPRLSLLRKVLHKIVFYLVRYFFKQEQKPFCQTNPVLSQYTTGFGVICQK